LAQLQQLEKLDELKKLDKLSELKELERLTALTDAPPIMPAPQTAPAPVEVKASYQKSFKDYALDFVLDLLRTLVLAAVLVGIVLAPQGRKMAGQAAAFLGFGHGTQVSWALETLARVAPDEFASYWADFETRLHQEADLVFNMRAPWTLEKRYEVLHELWSYQFTHQNISLHNRVKLELHERASMAEKKWMDRLNIEIAQFMAKQSESQRLALWNQLKDLAVGGKWADLLKTARHIPDDRFAAEASVIAMVHLIESDEHELMKIMEK